MATNGPVNPSAASLLTGNLAATSMVEMNVPTSSNPISHLSIEYIGQAGLLSIPSIPSTSVVTVARQALTAVVNARKIVTHVYGIRMSYFRVVSDGLDDEEIHDVVAQYLSDQMEVCDTLFLGGGLWRILMLLWMPLNMLMQSIFRWRL